MFFISNGHLFEAQDNIDLSVAGYNRASADKRLPCGWHEQTLLYSVKVSFDKILLTWSVYCLELSGWIQNASAICTTFRIRESNELRVTLDLLIIIIDFHVKRLSTGP